MSSGKRIFVPVKDAPYRISCPATIPSKTHPTLPGCFFAGASIVLIILLARVLNHRCQLVLLQQRTMRHRTAEKTVSRHRAQATSFLRIDKRQVYTVLRSNRNLAPFLTPPGCGPRPPAGRAASSSRLTVELGNGFRPTKRGFRLS